MPEPDNKLIIWTDLPAALGLLSRLPLRVNTQDAAARGAAAAWAYPLAGACIGVFLASIASLAMAAGLSAPFSAGLTLFAAIMITGAMHEDGLADSADGLWGGWDKARRLEIMKDSRIGAYGVLALILSLLLRWSALSAILGTHNPFAPLIMTAALSRTPMVAIMALLPNARQGGLSASVGRPSSRTMWLALGAGVAVTLALFGLSALLLLLICTLAALACTLIAHRKIGGQTGDILGATQQICEIALLATLSVQLS